MNTKKIQDTLEAWETGALGADAKFAKAISPEEQVADQAAIDAAFGLKPISIRMEIEILENLKTIAKHRGLGYQPLIRQILQRWVDSELKQIAIEAMESEKEKPVKYAMKRAA